MRKLLNTLYVTPEDSYLSLDGGNTTVLDKEREIGRFPLHNLERIASSGYRGTSPTLMGVCADQNTSLCFVSPGGRFLARVMGSIRGNAVLRDKQYRTSMDEDNSLGVVKNCTVGKVCNAGWALERSTRDHSMQVDVEKVKHASLLLKDAALRICNCESKDSLRGFEGEVASIYFGVFDELILQQRKGFAFSGRNRRPPIDSVNAMLSFAYTLLTNHIASALGTVGLDPYVGVFHIERPGRVSLALDLIEELRLVLTDCFALSMINKKIAQKKDFLKKEDGAVLMKDDARKRFLTEWQNRKKEMLTHPYLQEKIGWGMVSYARVVLLARYLRGDLDAYSPLLWK